MSIATVEHKISFAHVNQTADDRTLIFQISNGKPDREGDELPPRYWDLRSYLQNPVVLLSHDYGSLPVGKCTKVWVDGDALMAEIQFARHEQAETVYQLCKQGFLSATSVGFKPTSSALNSHGGQTFNGPMELLEVSIVPVPCNREALIQARAAGINLQPVLKWLEMEEDAVILEIDTRTKGFVSCPRGTACKHTPMQAVEDCPLDKSCPLWMSSSGDAIVVLPGWSNLTHATQGPHPEIAGNAVPGNTAQPDGWTGDIINPRSARRPLSTFTNPGKTGDGFYRPMAERAAEKAAKRSFDPFPGIR